MNASHKKGWEECKTFPEIAYLAIQKTIKSTYTQLVRDVLRAPFNVPESNSVFGVIYYSLGVLKARLGRWT